MVKRESCVDQFIERAFWSIFLSDIEYVIDPKQWDTNQEDHELVWIVVVVRRSKRDKKDDDEHRRLEDRIRLTFGLTLEAMVGLVVVDQSKRDRKHDDEHFHLHDKSRLTVVLIVLMVKMMIVVISIVDSSQ